MVSEIADVEWVAEVIIDHTYKHFTVKRVTNVSGQRGDVSLLFRPFVFVKASDELGAFNAAIRVMRDLNLTAVTDTSLGANNV